MEAIRRSRLSEQILDSVVNMIKQNGYEINDKLPTEKEIALSLGVGRNSVREAMKMLNMANITQSIAGKGTFLITDPENIKMDSSVISNAVSEVSTMELLQARMIIETEAASLGAQHAKKDSIEWKMFEKSYNELIKSLENRGEDTSKKDFNFHTELVKLCGNRFLYKMIHSIVSDIHESKKIITIDFKNADFEKEIHTKIFEAIKNSKPDKAKEAMKIHFENTMKYCKKI